MPQLNVHAEAKPFTRWSRICESAAVARLRPRRMRRRLVATAMLWLVAMPVTGWLTGQVWLVIALFVPYTVTTVLLAASTGGLFDRRVSSLDERQRELRLNVLREPYMTGATIGLLGGLIVAASLQAGDGPMMGLVLAVLSGLYQIPSMRLAWTLRDEPTDDE